MEQRGSPSPGSVGEPLASVHAPLNSFPSMLLKKHALTGSSKPKGRYKRRDGQVEKKKGVSRSGETSKNSGVNKIKIHCSHV